MRDSKRSLAAVALAAALFAPAAGPAFAAGDATVYASESEFDAVAGAADFTINFNGSVGMLVPGTIFNTAIAFGSPEIPNAPNLVLWSGNAITDAGSSSGPNGVGPISGVFTGTAMAFKFQILSADVPPTLDLYDASDALIDTVAAPDGAGFFGVISATPIKRFVIHPGVFDASTGFRDRFFVDDFSATAVVEFPEEEPPAEEEPPVDLAGLCDDLAAAVAEADNASFSNKGKKGALGNKLDAVCALVEAGDADSLAEALDKLTHDVLPKTDGEPSPGDWVTDPGLQQDLEDRILDLIAALQDALDA